LYSKRLGSPGKKGGEGGKEEERERKLSNGNRILAMPSGFEHEAYKMEKLEKKRSRTPDGRRRGSRSQGEGRAYT